jgi:hypothetical protein
MCHAISRLLEDKPTNQTSRFPRHITIELQSEDYKDGKDCQGQDLKYSTMFKAYTSHLDRPVKHN